MEDSRTIEQQNNAKMEHAITTMVQASTSELTAHVAITSTLHLLLSALDNNNLPAFLSTFDGDSATMTLIGGSITHLPNLNSIITRIFNTIGPMDTTHQIGNVDIDFREEGAAALRCYVWAMHKREGEGKDPKAEKYATGAEYRVEFVEREDGWKVKAFEVEVVWCYGEPGVMKQTL
jgi:hypothetical protein